VIILVNYPNYLAGSQDDINKRLLHMILDLKNSEGADIDALEEDVSDIKDAIGDESTADSILGRIKALEDAE
jgi:hypothetical protein